MTVLGESVLILPDKVKESVIITEEVKTLSDRAIVVSVGEGVSTVGEGDRIFFNNKAGRFIELDDKEFVLVHITDIFIKGI